MNRLSLPFIALAAALGAGCATRSIGPDSFGTAIAAFQPPEQYASWYEELRRCAGGDRPFEAIRWYQARPGTTFLDPQTGELLAGYWTARRDAIILGAGYVDDPAVVKHELLHYLRRSGNHRDPAFGPGNRCGVAPAPGPPPVIVASDGPAEPRRPPKTGAH